MNVGASYYPELVDPQEWRSDLAAGRELGLTVLRCGEFAWSTFSPEPQQWSADWALSFLDLAHAYGYEVIWCTPTATPPPYVFDRWPDLTAVNTSGLTVPVGVRRNYCPSHKGYLELCAQIADRLGRELGAHPAIVGWQIDNELAGDGFTCWCERCRQRFQHWLAERYGTLQELNAAWQTGFWSQRYSDWTQVPLPVGRFGSHAPSLRLDYRRCRSDIWLNFYRRQAEILRRHVSRPVTTNFFNYSWDVPFDLWTWRPHVDAIGISHYLEDDNASHFQLALIAGIAGSDKPIWVLEQSPGRHALADAGPAHRQRLTDHLRRCAEVGVEYAIYWHLRRHVSGCEMDHGAVLRADGRPGRIAAHVKHAIAATKHLPHVQPSSDAPLLVFSFDQCWGQEARPTWNGRWSYCDEMERHWYGGMRDAFGHVRAGTIRDIAAEQGIVVAPFLQVREAGLEAAIDECLRNGGTFITTADVGRLDAQGNIARAAPLDLLSRWVDPPQVELLHMGQEDRLEGRIGETAVTGRLFWALPETDAQIDEGSTIGTLAHGEDASPVAWCARVEGGGRLVVVFTSLDRAGVAALLRDLMRERDSDGQDGADEAVTASSRLPSRSR